MSVPVQEIVDFLGGSYAGPPDRSVSGVATLAEATESDLAFLENPKYEAQVKGSRAGAILVPQALAGDDARWIRVGQPRLAFGMVIRRWFDRPRPAPGISAHAAVSPTAKVGKDVSIGAFVAIGDDAVIEDGVVLHDGVSIGRGAKIGAGTTIYPHVVIYEGCVIGARCIVHANTVIGADGFGYAFAGGRHEKIPQIGIVRIEDDVEIGANSCVDRAALGVTVIGAGTKIDNLVQVAHNCRIGRHVILVSQVGVAGSTQIGDYSVLAGQAGVAGHITIGDRVTITAQTGVIHDVPSDAKMIGFPAAPFRDWARDQVYIKKIPAMLERLSAMEKKLGRD